MEGIYAITFSEVKNVICNYNFSDPSKLSQHYLININYNYRFFVYLMIVIICI